MTLSRCVFETSRLPMDGMFGSERPTLALIKEPQSESRWRAGRVNADLCALSGRQQRFRLLGAEA